MPLTETEINYPIEHANEIRPDKDPARVNKGYITCPKDWLAQYKMLLPDGITCKNCRHCKRCVILFDQSETSTSCQFYPSRYYSLKMPA